jgi:hypothetical protein
MSGRSGVDIFPLLVLTGRPASGKSEILDYLRGLPPAQRRKRFRLGRLEVVDDFPMLWSWFEEDHILEEMGRPRLHTTSEGYFKAPYLWDLLIRRLCLEYDKLRRSAPRLQEQSTVVLEFSRGSSHGGYARAFAHFSAAVAAAASILYVRVSFQESLRKNRRRFNPDRPHSILEHSLPDAKLERLYREDDWERLAAGGQGSLRVQERRVAYAVFENEDDVTTGGGPPLGERLEKVLDRLWGERAMGAKTALPAAGPS